MRKNLVVAVAGLGLMAALAPAPMRAADPPVYYCSGGALNVCASVVPTVNGTTLTLNVWNLFNFNASNPPAGGLSYFMTWVGIGNSGWSGTATLSSAMWGGTNVMVGNHAWQQDNTVPQNFVAGQIDAAAVESGAPGSVSPCGSGFGLATCLLTPLVLTFTTSTPFVTDGAVYGWHAQSIGTTGCSAWVGSDGSSTVDQSGSCASVTPEPVTMALLGTGLLGMGGAGLVRRRRKNGDVTNS